ncbi:hypothetical protein DPMN_044068 [Dreissena polymorpha]|uniref:Uncharacterized protein n=1 Tax=Dreissena polymorpha TaxID=45954 RepID=A0A9D4D2K1_DREPO|nr:hypothetical protein DPMN_044068 [Dreissena polymorpha]
MPTSRFPNISLDGRVLQTRKVIAVVMVTPTWDTSAVDSLDDNCPLSDQNIIIEWTFGNVTDKHDTSMLTQKGKHATSMLTKKGKHDTSMLTQKEHATSMLTKAHDTSMLTKKGSNDLVVNTSSTIHPWGVHQT